MRALRAILCFDSDLGYRESICGTTSSRPSRRRPLRRTFDGVSTPSPDSPLTTARSNINKPTSQSWAPSAHAPRTTNTPPSPATSPPHPLSPSPSPNSPPTTPPNPPPSSPPAETWASSTSTRPARRSAMTWWPRRSSCCDCRSASSRGRTPRRRPFRARGSMRFSGIGMER